jgi:hypothetical protein
MATVPPTLAEVVAVFNMCGITVATTNIISSRKDMALTLFGLVITMVKENSTKVWNWQSNRFSNFVTRTREPFHSRNTVLHF